MHDTILSLPAELRDAALGQPAQGAFKPLSLGRSLRVAVVGSGKAAAYHLKALSAIDGVELACLVNRGRSDPTPLMEAHGIQEHYTDLNQALAKCRFDAAIACVTWTSTQEVAMSLMRAGIPVLIEKPLGTCLEQSKAIRTASESSRVPACVGYNRRFYTATLAACEFVSIYGAPYSVTVEAPENLDKLGGDKYGDDEIGDRLIKNTTHAIDMFTLFSGSHRALSGPGSRRSLDGYPIDFVRQMSFENGTTGVFLSHWRSPGDWIVTLYGPGYRATINLTENSATFVIGKRAPKPIPPCVFDRKFKAGVYLQNYHFLKAVADGNAVARPAASIASGCETMRLAEAIRTVT
jgi:myo-inositol 2-dehydrogenase / D-chiro-inositol 1-dehydrogenase